MTVPAIEPKKDPTKAVKNICDIIFIIPQLFDLTNT